MTLIKRKAASSQLGSHSQAAQRPMDKRAQASINNSPARGTLTREKLLDTAMLQFGQHGFEGVSARALASAAGVPLSAIPYHFQTMEALYRETLMRVLQEIDERLAPAVAVAEHAAVTVAPELAANAVKQLLGELLRALVVSPVSNDWARLLMREMQTPGAICDAMGEGVMDRAHRAICALIERASGRNRKNVGTRLQAFALMGQAMIFRHIQEVVKRELQWHDLGEREWTQMMSALRVDLS